MTTKPISALVQPHLPRVRAIRHDLHRHPELSFRESRTSEAVQRELASLNIRFIAGLGAPSPGGQGTGVLGFLPATPAPNSPPPRTVALRADMDALPIQEQTGVEYASTVPGVMHACGHDGHTAILLGAARALAACSVRPNHTLLIFQPAEEGGAGAEKMCRDGVLDGREFGHKADYVFGLHGWPELELGTIATRDGPMLASTDDFVVTIRGKGGHAAQPHLCTDPVLVAAQIVTAIQSIASRRISPFEPVVVTVASIHAGSANNIIPESATIIGTARTLSPDARLIVESEFRRIVSGVAGAMGAASEIAWNRGYPVTLNHPVATRWVREVGSRVLGFSAVLERPHPTMGGEDFAYYSERAQASFAFLGLKPAQATQIPGLHAPGFNFNDDALPFGIELMVGLALNQLAD